MNKGLKKSENRNDYMRWNHSDDPESRLKKQRQNKIINIITKPFKILFRVISTFVVVIFIIIFIGNLGKSNPMTKQVSVLQPTIAEPQVNGQTFTNSDFVLTSKGSGNNGIDQYISGTIKNVSDKNYSYAEVEINLYDANKNQVGSTLANINNFQTGTTWDFKAHYINDSVKSYRIINIKGQ